jgi:hypothetical protein
VTLSAQEGDHKCAKQEVRGRGLERDGIQRSPFAIVIFAMLLFCRISR